jgi:hypothetical protein
MIDLPAPVSPVMTVSPSPKFHVEFVDDRELADRNLREHGAPPLSVRSYTPDVGRDKPHYRSARDDSAAMLCAVCVCATTAGVGKGEVHAEQ